MESIDKTLKYHELLMIIDNIDSIELNTKLPDGFNFVFYSGEKDKISWVKIHLSSGEFTSYNRAFNYFDIFYKEFEKELNKRCFFIEYKGEKIATATISPSNEYGYGCVIDWLAIRKEYQGYRLSRPLICKCLELAKDLGNNKILLHTQTHTWLAAKLYLDIGFNPLFIEENDTGWRILKNITNHYKLEDIDSIEDNEMYDELSLDIIKNLNDKHNLYSYEIWYKNNQNDVYVREKDVFYHYKFYDNGKILKLIEKYDDCYEHK